MFLNSKGSSAFTLRIYLSSAKDVAPKLVRKSSFLNLYFLDAIEFSSLKRLEEILNTLHINS